MGTIVSASELRGHQQDFVAKGLQRRRLKPGWQAEPLEPIHQVVALAWSQRAMAGRPNVGGFPYLAEIAKRLATRQPAAHRAAIGVVGRAKCGAKMRLFVEDDKQMREEKPRQREKQNGGRLFVQAEA
jgi:hypothetical protein